MTSNQIDTIEKVHSWIAFNKIEPSDSMHFYLQGDSLDNFSKYIIINAQSSVLVSNPFVERCALSDTLIEARTVDKHVLLLTRPIHSKDRYYSSKKDYHELIKSANVVLAYNENIHAKIIVVDGCVAVISSLNFISTSSPGKTWEAGIVSFDPNVVKKVNDSLDSILKSRDTSFQNPIMRITIEKTTEKASEKIFSYLTEPELIPVWNPLIERVERESSLPLRVGSIQYLHTKNSDVIKEVYLQYSDNEMFSVTSNNKGVIGFGKWELFPTDSGTSVRTTQGAVYNKIMNGNEFNIIKKIIEKYIKKLLDQLIEIA